MSSNRFFARFFALSCALLFTMSLANAQTPVAPANYDEIKIPPFTLTDPLKTTDGRIVDTPEMWNTVRRPELLKLFDEHMFGKVSFSPDHTVVIGVREFPPKPVFNGKGTRHIISITIRKRPLSTVSDNDPTINVLLYVPNNVQGKVPMFLGLNFQGNHTVDADPGIPLGTVWNREGQPVPATEEERGRQSDRWQIEKVLDRGYATATAYYQEIEPDFNGGSKHGVRQLFDQKGELNEGNAIATWAWALSQIRSLIAAHAAQANINIDPDKIIVHGHSRLGKTALWAGALDRQFAMVISNNSGCGGAALSRREFGETVHRINTAFPHWFNGNFKKYNLDVNALPFDQHELIALIAPRPVYIASAEEDRWADPKGEFLSALYADPVYRLLGTDGIAGVKEMPEVNRPVGGTIGYHIRTGAHDVTEYDWEQFLDFANKHLK